jgi:hypothetical protein
MARSRRALKVLGSVDELVAELPARFLEITVGEKPVQVLSTYVAELSAWILGEGGRPELVQKTTVEVMEAIDASPADWYLRRSRARSPDSRPRRVERASSSPCAPRQAGPRYPRARGSSSAIISTSRTSPIMPTAPATRSTESAL